MTSLLNYFISFISPDTISNTEITANKYNVTEEFESDYSVVDKKFLISAEDLEKVDLKPLGEIIPAPSRNMPPLSRVNLQSLNKAQLNTILNVQLKPTPPRETNKTYESRHPVLRELISRFKSS